MSETAQSKKTKPDPLHITTFILALVLAIIAGFYFGRLSIERPDLIPSLEPTPVSCTLEALLCPDGSTVGRVGPNCEFAPCPDITRDINPTVIPSVTQKSVTDDCPPGYVQYGIPLGCVTEEYMKSCQVNGNCPQ